MYLKNNNYMDILITYLKQLFFLCILFKLDLNTKFIKLISKITSIYKIKIIKNKKKPLIIYK